MRYFPACCVVRAKTVGLVLSGVLLALPCVNAQEAEAVRGGPEEPTEIVTIRFGGGSLADYVAEILAVTDAVNIILPAAAVEVDVPAIALQRASIDAALNVVADVIDDSHQVRVRRLNSDGGRPVYTVRVDTRSRSRGNTSTGVMGASPAERSVEVFSLRILTMKLPGDPADANLVLSAETILTAIDTGLGADGDSDAPKAQLKYHADSGLLFVAGTRGQIRTAHAVLSSLRDDMQRVRGAAMIQHQRKGVAKSNPIAEPSKN